MASERRSARKTWIGSPGWDALWIFSGLWAPLLMIFGYAAATGFTRNPLTGPTDWHERGQLALLFAVLAVLHRLSSIYAVVVSPTFAVERRANPTRYVYRPLLILGACVTLGLAMAFHGSFAFAPTRYGQLWPFFLLGYAMILWERWHFCMQEFGVLSIYRARAEQLTPADRLFDRVYVVVLMLGVNMVLYVCLGFPDERGVLFYGTPIATSEGPLLQTIATAAFAVGAVATLTAIVREVRHPKRSLPKLLFYVLVGGHTLVLYFFPSALSLFFLSYVVHHWMVAIGLFNRVTLNGYANPSRAGRALTYAKKVGPFLLVALFAQGFFAQLDFASKLTPLPPERIFEGASAAARLSAGVIVGFFFAFNYLHYYYDRCLYSFGVPGVRKAVMPLLFGTASRAAPRAQGTST
jgi:hypothetical protein